ncbi:MAG: WXG100 family type VII secretion target [Anaerolineales bacterium]|nr:WXG100 family type VII secretion target [Anaerolineales bacterium]
MSNTIQADYEQLESIAGNFGKEADNSTAMTARVRKSYEDLKNGGWLGRGAEAFFNEMDSEILPALERFFAALEKGQSVTQQIVGDVRQTEEEAAGLFKGDGAASTGGAGASAGAGAGGASGAAAAGPGGGGASGAGGTGGAGVGVNGAASPSSKANSPELDLATDLGKAVGAATKSLGFLGELKGADRIKALAKSELFEKRIGPGLAGVNGLLSALGKDVSTPAAIVDGLAQGGLGEVIKLGPKAGIASAVTGVIHGITEAVAPDYAKYTGIANDVMPDETAGKLVSNAIHTYDALIRGDTERVIQQQERLLNGEYGEVLRGYSIATETVGALVTGDDQALNKISEAAGSGKLGPVAEFGDWLGGAIYDITH